MSGFHPGIPEHYRNEVVTGDARLLAEALPDESVDLIFTDPVYDRIEDYEWLARESRRVLRPGAAALIFCGIGWLGETIAALQRGGLRYRWPFVLHHAGRTGFHAPAGFSQYTLCLWFDGDGSSKARRQVPDVRGWQPEPAAILRMRERWFQDPNFCDYYATAFCAPGGVVWDPFTGTGTIPAVCRWRGMQFVASEIEPERATLARERVRLTPLPLLLPEPEPHPSLFAEALP